MQFLVMHGRIGLVEVLVTQPDEVIQHLLSGCGAAEKSIDGSLCPVGIGQDAEEIDKGLLGDFRTGDERRIGKIEVVPVMQGQVRRPVFRRRQRDRHVGQTEFIGFLLLGM